MASGVRRPADGGPPPEVGGGVRGRSQALKDLKLAIEYKYLKQNAPGGVIVVPSYDNLRLWHGVIFVRKGVFQDAIFKFTIELPFDYNDHDSWPSVKFVSDVFNPFVDPATGSLDIKTHFPRWDPTRHFMVSVLIVVKKIFYLKEADVTHYKRPANAEALQMFLMHKEGYRAKAREGVQASLRTVFDRDLDSPLNFTQPQAAHENVRDALQKLGGVTVPSAVEVLEACGRAREVSSTSPARPPSKTVI